MHRFFIDYKVTTDEILISDKNDVKHIVRALRVQIGEKLEVCDSSSEEYVVEVLSLNEEVKCKVIGKNDVKRESPVKIDLYQGRVKAKS